MLMSSLTSLFVQSILFHKSSVQASCESTEPQSSTKQFYSPWQMVLLLLLRQDSTSGACSSLCLVRRARDLPSTLDWTIRGSCLFFFCFCSRSARCCGGLTYVYTCTPKRRIIKTQSEGLKEVTPYYIQYYCVSGE